MVDIRLLVACAVAVLATRDVGAAKNTMVCVESSEFDGEECTVIGDRGGGTDVDTLPATVVGPGPDKSTGGGSSSSSTAYAHTTEPDSRPNPCDACVRDRRRALDVSRHIRDLCVETAFDDAMRACTGVDAHPVLGTIDGRGRTVRPIHDGMLCCEKSNEAETALQNAAQINPTVRGCGLVPVGYTGRVCLVGTVEKWWADTFGHDACPYTRILKCEPGYLIDPDNCIQSYTVGAPGTTNTTGSTAGVALDGGPAKFTGSGSQSNSTTWGQTGGSLADCRERARTRNRDAETTYGQCWSQHDCASAKNQPPPTM